MLKALSRIAVALATTLACVGAAALTASPVVKQDAPTVKPRKGEAVKDLHYGDVLFYFYEDDFFESIVRFNAYRQQGYEQPHGEDGEILLGGMLLSYGQHEQAEAIFHRLLDTSSKPSVRNRAWYFLARIAYEHGNLMGAARALDSIKGDLPPEFEPQRHLLLSQVLIEEERYDDAAAMLSSWKSEEPWLSYAHFNLGVAQIRGGHVDAGLQTLDAIGAAPAPTPELQALRDRINLTLGFERLRADQASASVPAFQRIRLDGPFSNKALLGLGWAESAQSQDRDALIPWMELGKRDILDPAVEESLLAVPYAFGKLSIYGQAAAHYQDAIAAFDAESKRLDDSIARIQSGQLINDLLADKDAEKRVNDNIVPITGWNWQLDKLPLTPESGYLTHLLASREFQQGLKNYRDLRFARNNLDRWSRDIGTFSDMLDTRRQSFEQKKPATEAALGRIDLDSIRQHRDTLAARLKTIEDSQDADGLANDHELQQLAMLKSINERIDHMGDAPEAAGLRDQARLLKGVLSWNLLHDYSLRLWQQQRSLKELDEALDKAVSQRQSVADAEKDEETHLQSFGDRITQQTPRITELLAKTDTLIASQQKALEDLAVAQLQDYQKRLHGYTVEARYALAQIYDRAASRPQTSEAAPALTPPPAQPPAPGSTP
jgi:hypothetical protein